MSAQNLANGDHPYFFGVVEDRMDPENKRRVRVRCFGIHTADKSEIPTSALPWARVMIPANVGRNNTTNIWEGTLVFGVFADGRERQQPFVLGIVPSNEVGGSPLNGFTDPRESAPVGKPGKTLAPYSNYDAGPGTTLYADSSSYGGSTAGSTKVPLEGSKRTGGATYNEPENPAAPGYPYNNVDETESGHVIELDDTPGAERVHIFHRGGSFIEFHPDGKVVYKTVGDNHYITLQNRFITVNANDDTGIAGNSSTYVGGAYTLEVTGGDADIKVTGGNVNLYVNGNVNETVTGDVTRTISGNVTENITGSYSRTVGSTINDTAGGSITIVAPTINLN